MSDLSGQTIKRYQIIKKLGEGGMAIVYLASDPMLDRKVAIKMIHAENTTPSKTAARLKRFNMEAKTLAGLTHPHIVKVLDFGDYEGSPYLVMEYLANRTLSARMDKPIPYVEAAALLIPLAHALQHAHKQKLIHRDVKPDNILFNDSNQPLLSDFGIIKKIDQEESQGITATGGTVGTLAYMSPEQLRGLEIDGRSDIYSLGIVFFEMITGRKPYNAGTPIGLSMQHMYDPIPKAKQYVRDLPAEVEQVIATALAKKPEERFQSMQAFAGALEKIIETARGEARPNEHRPARRPLPEKKPIGPQSNLPLKSIFFSLTVILLLGSGLIYSGILPIPTKSTTPMETMAAVTETNVSATTSVTESSPTTSVPVTESPPPSTPSPTTIPEIIIQPNNAASLIAKNRIDRISVINLDWVDGENGLIDIGSGNSATVSFLDYSNTTPAEKVNLSEDKVPLAMAVAPEQGSLYILFNDNIKVLELTPPHKVIKKFSPITGGARSIAVSSDGKLLALGISDNMTQILQTLDGSVLKNIPSALGGWTVNFSPDSKYVISGTSQGVLRWETGTWNWRSVKGGTDKVIKSLAISHDGQRIAAGGNGFIYIWSMVNGELLQQLPVANTIGIVHSLDFSRDDQLLVSGSDDKLVQVWDVNSGTLVKKLEGHTGAVVAVCFSPDGKNIASGSNDDTTIRIWGLP